MNRLIKASVLYLSISGCSSVLTQPTTLPTCEQILPILQSSGSEFENIKSGPIIHSREYSTGYWQSVIKLPDAESCIVRESYGLGTQYVCKWNHDNDSQSMGQHYQDLRDRIISCVGDVSVYKDDRRGYTSITLTPLGNLSSLKYIITTQYQRLPFTVSFRVDAD